MAARSNSATMRLLQRLFTRDRSIFLVGLAGAFNEIFIRSGEPRSSIIALVMGMMGLPAFLKWDDRSGDDGDGHGS